MTAERENGRAPDSRREHLRHWLTHWKIEGELAGIAEAPPDPDSRAVPVSAAPSPPPYDHTDFAPGEIRLLGHESFPSGTRPVYVAILDAWGRDMRLIAPFAPFPVPATKGELLLDGRSAFLAVLSLWNARSTPLSILGWSWLCDVLMAEELADARAVFANITTGRSLPDALVPRVGLPVYRSHDPRLDYQHGEAATLAPLSQAAQDFVELLNAIETFDDWVPGEPASIPAIPFRPHLEQLHNVASEMPLAAADANPFSRATIFRGDAPAFLKTFAQGDFPDLAKAFEASLRIGPMPMPGDPARAAVQWSVSEASGLPVDAATFLLIDTTDGRLFGSGDVTAGLASLRTATWSEVQKRMSWLQDWLLVILLQDGGGQQK